MSDFSDTGYDSIGVDHDGDGFAETTYADTTGDGTIDTVAEYDPYTGASAVAADTTGDGVIDTVAVDYDGDGLIDEAYTEDTGTDVIDDPVDDTATDDGPFVADDELVDTDDGADLPDDGDDSDDGIHGEPRADIDYHQVQPGPVDCLPTSVSMALSEITGTHVPADELVAMANEHGFMTDTGMSALDSVTLFENYGVEAEATSGTLDDLRDALDRGDPIIVGVDAADVYSGGGGPFDPGMESGHAVVVTGIDDGPPGVLYINDPGFPDGAGVEIPLELFEDAWEDSENTMVVATAPAEGGAEAAEVGAVEAGEAAEGEPAGVRRLLLLPLTFLLEA
jgi:hypothetical protein